MMSNVAFSASQSQLPSNIAELAQWDAVCGDTALGLKSISDKNVMAVVMTMANGLVLLLPSEFDFSVVMTKK